MSFQKIDAEAADNDRREHGLQDGEILKQELFHNDFVLCDSAFLQQEGKDKAGEEVKTTAYFVTDSCGDFRLEECANNATKNSVCVKFCAAVFQVLTVVFAQLVILWKMICKAKHGPLVRIDIRSDVD